MIADVVVATLDRSPLADILPVIHTNGLGHVTRVLAAERGPIRGQLQRMGIPVEGAPESVLVSGTALVLSAAARSPMAAGLLLRSGAPAVWIVTRLGAWTPFDDAVIPHTPLPEITGPPPFAVPGLHDAPTAPDPASS